VSRDGHAAAVSIALALGLVKHLFGRGELSGSVGAGGTWTPRDHRCKYCKYQKYYFALHCQQMRSAKYYHSAKQYLHFYVNCYIAYIDFDTYIFLLILLIKCHLCIFASIIDMYLLLRLSRFILISIPMR
jgi:hypothetical protein